MGHVGQLCGQLMARCARLLVSLFAFRFGQLDMCQLTAGPEPFREFFGKEPHQPVIRVNGGYFSCLWEELLVWEAGSEPIR